MKLLHRNNLLLTDLCEQHDDKQPKKIIIQHNSLTSDWAMDWIEFSNVSPAKALAGDSDVILLLLSDLVGTLSRLLLVPSEGLCPSPDRLKSTKEKENMIKILD